MKIVYNPFNKEIYIWREKESDREKGTSSEKRREGRERESKPSWYDPFYDSNRHLMGKMQYKIFFLHSWKASVEILAVDENKQQGSKDYSVSG